MSQIKTKFKGMTRQAFPEHAKYLDLACQNTKLINNFNYELLKRAGQRAKLFNGYRGVEQSPKTEDGYTWFAGIRYSSIKHGDVEILLPTVGLSMGDPVKQGKKFIVDRSSTIFSRSATLSREEANKAVLDLAAAIHYSNLESMLK